MNQIIRYGIFTLLGLSLALNLGLAHRLRADQAAIRRMENALLSKKNESRLMPGARVSPLLGEDVDGSVRRVTYGEDSRPTLLYIYSPDCRWCQRNLNNIRALSQKLSASHRFVGISLADTPVGKRRQEADSLGFPVVFEIAPESRESYKFGGTPQTLIVSPEGMVIRNWIGAYAQGLNREVEAYFGLKLPGLVEAQASNSSREASRAGG